MCKPALFIDARNALYRAIYAVKADRRHNVKYHYFVVLLRQITTWMNKYRPGSVHVFWDAPRNTVWRKLVLEGYKNRTASTYVEDISEDLATTTRVAKEFFKVMGVRQYDRKQMEADDLIYAASVNMHPRPSVIVSTDSDMIQIPFWFASSTVYNPKKQEEVPVPECNPILQKALAGDKADSIDGYYGIGPVKSAALLESNHTLQEFLDAKGRRLFQRNMLLIDLSLCPRLLANRIYVQKVLSREVTYDKNAIDELIKKYKVIGFQTEYTDLTIPFMNLE
jgi:5'-3' exonuclease